MKKQLSITCLLVALDQAIKLLVKNLAPNANVVLIPNVIRFEPHQNTNLNWVASMAGFVMPVFLMLVIQLAAAIGVTLFYKSQKRAGTIRGVWLNPGYCMALAGILCSFIDVVLWGGSLDYIGLFDWFIFDLKDVFLNAGWICFAIGYLPNHAK